MPLLLNSDADSPSTFNSTQGATRRHFTGCPKAYGSTCDFADRFFGMLGEFCTSVVAKMGSFGGAVDKTRNVGATQKRNLNASSWFEGSKQDDRVVFNMGSHISN